MEQFDGARADADFYKDGRKDGDVAAVVVGSEGVLPVADFL